MVIIIWFDPSNIVGTPIVTGNELVLTMVAT